MRLKFLNYHSGNRIVSIAHDEETKADLTESRLHFIFVKESCLKLYPDDVELYTNEISGEQLRSSHNYDVLEIWNDGQAEWRYDKTASDHTFFITGSCNSNCIICPEPEYTRKNSGRANIPNLIEIARHIPVSVNHVTITGGEPFMAGEELFEFLQFLRNKFKHTEFQILTNGRIFALDKYVQMACRNVPVCTTFGIPIHGSNPTTHDMITQAKNSYAQTIAGVKNLLAAGMRVELRIVVTKLNIDEFADISDLIIREFSHADHICVMAPEMTGNAHVNREAVWVPYSEAFSRISGSVTRLVKSGVDVRLYNFPLCAVNEDFWMLCAKSISAGKIRYAECCDNCKYRRSCGGVFSGSLRLEKDDLKPIL